MVANRSVAQEGAVDGQGMKTAELYTKNLREPLEDVAVNARVKSIEEQATEITSRGIVWIERFRQRATLIAEDVLAKRTISDTKLRVPVYVHKQGYIQLPLYVLLTDPEWDNDAQDNSRMQCEVLHNTLMSSVIYAFLQEVSGLVRGASQQSRAAQSSPVDVDLEESDC